MARHRKFELDPGSDPALDISSLIDVCFLLLIYFLVTSSITTREFDLGMSLPSAYPGTEQPDIEPLFIKIEEGGIISTGVGDSQQTMDSDQSVRELPLLQSQLDLYGSAAKAANTKPVVQIWVDPNATQQRVIDVLNALAGAGINTVTFTDLIE